MKTAKKGIACILLFLLLLGLSFLLFSVRVDQLTAQSMEKQLSEVSESNTLSIKRVFDVDISFLNGVAQELLNSSNLSSLETMTFLKKLAGSSSFARIAVDLPDGTSYTTDGMVDNVSQMGYFQTALTGQPTVSDIYESSIDGKNSISVAVPIYDGEAVRGVLRGVYQSKRLSELMQFHTFGEAGYFNLADIHGGFLFDTEDISIAYHGSNLYEGLETVRFANDYSFDQLRKDIQQRKSGSSIYCLSGVDRYLYYEPFGYGNWYVLTVVQREHLLVQKNSIDIAMVYLLFFLLTMFFVLLGFVIFINRKAQKRVEKERDYLRNILNHIPLPVFITKAGKKIDIINEAALQLFHKKREDVIGQSCCQMHTANCGTSDCAIEQMIKHQTNRTYLEMDSKHYVVNSAFLDNAEGKINGFIEVIQDISDIVDMQKALEEKNLELSTISENLAGGILMTAMEKGFPIIRCNQGYCDLVGEKAERMIGKPALECVVAEEVFETEATIFSQLASGGVVSVEHQLQKANGQRIWVSLYGRQTQLQGKPIGLWMLRDISERKETERELRISEERYRVAIENTKDAIMDYNPQTRQIIHTARTIELYGVPERMEQVPESIVAQGIVAPPYVKAFLDLFRQINEGAEKASCVILSITENGQQIWNRLSFTAIFDNDHVTIRAIGVLQNITDEVEAKRQYEQEAHYREVLAQDAALYYEVNLTRKIFIIGHERFVKETPEVNDYDTVIWLLMESMVYKEDRQRVLDHISWTALMSAYHEGRRKIVFDYRRAVDGWESWVECTVYLLRDEGTKDIKALCYIRDINEMKMRELELREKAERDLLTGVYNKITTENLIKDYITSHLEGRGTFFLIDLDNFKLVNDTLGHAFGDAVLSDISQRIQKCFAETDYAGRVGGDEFVVFIPGEGNQMNAVNKARQICQMFHNTFTGNNNFYKVSGSVGIAFYPEHGASFEELYRKSDLALYWSKKNGKDTYHIYAEELLESQPGDTPLKERGIDDNAGKVFSENIIEYVIRILYEASEPERVINPILELVSRNFHYSRGYLFERTSDGQYWRNSFEWCEEGVSSQQEFLQAVPLTEWGDYFDKSGRIVVSDIQTLPPGMRAILEPQEVLSMVQFVLSKGGETKAFIGFDDCRELRQPSEDELSILQSVSQLLGAFLLHWK